MAITQTIRNSQSLRSYLFSLAVMPLMVALVIPSNIYAQASKGSDVTATSKPAETAPTSGSMKVGLDTNDEVIALRAQLELMHQYDQRLLRTVYWSLTVVVTLVLALITIIGFLNLRVYDRDKAALRQELMGLLREEFAKSEQALRKSLIDFEEEQRTRAGRNYEQLAGSIKETVEPLLRPVTQDIDTLRQRVMEIEYKRAKDEFSAWMETPVYGNALTSSLEILQIAMQFNWDWRISQALSYLKRALDAILKTKQSIPDAEDAKNVSEAIDKLPIGFSNDAQNLRELLRRVRAL